MFNTTVFIIDDSEIEYLTDNILYDTIGLTVPSNNGNVLYDQYRTIVDYNVTQKTITINEGFGIGSYATTLFVVNVAENKGSHAEGTSTYAFGKGSHAEGNKTAAIGNNSHAEGLYTYAAADCQHVQGKYNKKDSAKAFIIGGGTGPNDVNRKNIFTVDWYGNTFAAGNLTFANGKNIYFPNSSSGDSKISFENDTSYIKYYGSNDGELILYSVDNIILNTATISNSGVITATSFSETSDVRLKNIHSELDLDKAYELIDKCSTIIYDLKDDPTHKEQIGMIAQEIQEFFPEVVSENKDGFLSIDYSRLTVIIMRVLKDLISDIKDIKKILH